MRLGRSIKGYLKTKRFELGPAWRWKLAQLYLTSGLPNCFWRDAPVVAEIWQYLRWRARPKRSEIRPNFSLAMHQKVDRLNTDATTVATLKMMVLAGCPLEDICQRTGLDRITFEYWRRSFLDITEERTFGSWMYGHVIEPEIQAGNHRLAAKLQSAYGGGVQVVNAILRAEAGLPKDEAESKLFMEIEMVLRLREALMVPFESETKRMQQIRISLKWLARQDRLAVAKARYEAKTAEEHRRLKVAEYRHEQRTLRVQIKEQRRADRLRERLEIANATAQLREIALADFEKLWSHDQRTGLAAVASSPLSALKWSSSKSVQRPPERLILPMPSYHADQAGAYTATYLDQVDLLASTADGCQATTMFVGADVDPLDVCIPDAGVVEWSHLS